METAGATKKRPGSDHGAIDGPSPESVIERITREWAFATSPDGLRLSPARFWRSTWNGLAALKEVHAAKERGKRYRWAIGRAEYRNANRLLGEHPAVLWIAEDFLGTGDRSARIIEYDRKQLETRRIAAELAKITQKSDPRGLPSWAIAKGSGPGGGWTDAEIAKALGGKRG